MSPATHSIGLKKWVEGGAGNDNNNAPGCQLSIWVAETLTKQYWDWDSAGVTGDELPGTQVLNSYLKNPKQLQWNQKCFAGDFPGSPGAKTLCFQCRGPGFEPWSRN